MKTLEEKLLSCYEVQGECWVLNKYFGDASGTQRQTDGIGYPRIPHKVNGKRVRFSAHRTAYEIWVGPIPDGHEVDHTCHNKLCINPAHLEAVTHPENLRRRRPYKRNAKKKTL